MLERNLRDLAEKKERYPFHMPGHKRVAMENFPNPYSIDITEIEDFDNLHHAKEVLKEEQELAASLYGSKYCHYLVNGSTCGILAAVSASVRRGEKILVARNCHKAVYHALYLRQLSPVYVYPVTTSQGLQGQVTVESIEEKLNQHPDIKAVIITSPTYDGIVSDVKGIAGVVHERGIPLIVDEAHGAHFGFHPAFPKNAVLLGADAVIMSLHKTLPAFTQTALLHLCSDRIDHALIQRFLAIYETSSPSYILMAGISRCIHMMSEKEFQDKMHNYVSLLEEFQENTRGLQHLRILGKDAFSKGEAYDFDIGKLIVETGTSGLHGQQLKERLLSEYELQMEMASGNYVLAMTSVMDSREGLCRLQEALHAIDGSLKGDKKFSLTNPALIYREQEKILEIHEALESKTSQIDFAEAAGCISAEYIYLYPPGIPILVPGEKISVKTINEVLKCERLGLKVEGLLAENAMEVVKNA